MRRDLRMSPLRSAGALCAATAVSLGLPAIARAQNTEPFYYSEDAAKVAGAVVARPGDSAALHYCA